MKYLKDLPDSVMDEMFEEFLTKNEIDQFRFSYDDRFYPEEKAVIVTFGFLSASLSTLTALFFATLGYWFFLLFFCIFVTTFCVGIVSLLISANAYDEGVFKGNNKNIGTYRVKGNFKLSYLLNEKSPWWRVEQGVLLAVKSKKSKKDYVSNQIKQARKFLVP